MKKNNEQDTDNKIKKFPLKMTPSFENKYATIGSKPKHRKKSVLNNNILLNNCNFYIESNSYYSFPKRN